MSIRHRIRLAAQRIGIDVSRFPGADPIYVLVRLLQSHSVDVVLDIGANSGRYGEDLRRLGYAGRIISFEPLSAPFAKLAAAARSDSGWEVHRCALGDADCRVTMNVAANDGESSSILPMLDAHITAAPSAVYVGTEDAELRKLDSLVPEFLLPGDRIFLKADVQGYERSVLAGAQDTLRDHCVGIQLEMSLVPLYEGAMLYREAIELAESLGLTLMGMIPGFIDPRNGRLLQIDGIFMREGEMQ
jgi:FkbM family methyltransferase